MGGKWGGIDPRQKIGANFGTPWVTIMILYRLLVTFTEKVMLTFLVAFVCLLVGWFDRFRDNNSIMVKARSMRFSGGPIRVLE